MRLSTKDVAKIIRKKLKAEFPDCKFSVRTDYGATTSEITVSLVEAPFNAILKAGHCVDGAFVETVDYGYHQLNQYAYNGLPGRGCPDRYNNGVVLSQEAWDIMRRVVEIDSEYNWDKSDPMTDYFNVHHYLSLEIGRWDKPFKMISKRKRKREGQ